VAVYSQDVWQQRYVTSCITLIDDFDDWWQYTSGTLLVALHSQCIWQYATGTGGCMQQGLVAAHSHAK